MADEWSSAIEYEALLLSRHVHDLPGRSRRRSGSLDQSAYTLLSLLHAGGATSIGELSAITGLDASTLNRQTHGLLEKQLAERIPDPEGGIARKFRATDAGRAALLDERAASARAIDAITASWSQADRQALATLLRRFNEGIEARAERRPWPR